MKALGYFAVVTGKGMQRWIVTVFCLFQIIKMNLVRTLPPSFPRKQL